MTNLVLSRRAGQSVQLLIGDRTEYLHVLGVNGGQCIVKLDSAAEASKIKFHGVLQIAEGVSVTLADSGNGLAKLCFSAPREVRIMRTELLQELAE